VKPEEGDFSRTMQPRTKIIVEEGLEETAGKDEAAQLEQKAVAEKESQALDEAKSEFKRNAKSSEEARFEMNIETEKILAANDKIINNVKTPVLVKQKTKTETVETVKEAEVQKES